MENKNPLTFAEFIQEVETTALLFVFPEAFNAPYLFTNFKTLGTCSKSNELLTDTQKKNIANLKNELNTTYPNLENHIQHLKYITPNLTFSYVSSISTTPMLQFKIHNKYKNIYNFLNPNISELYIYTNRGILQNKDMEQFLLAFSVCADFLGIK